MRGETGVHGENLSVQSRERTNKLNQHMIRSDEGLTLETSAFRISVRWPIYIINSVDKTKFLYTTSPPTQHHSFFRNYPFNIWRRVWESNTGHIDGRRVLSPLRHPCKL